MNCSVAVIGGGIAGLSVAFELLESGYKVTLLERERTCGTGASAAPSGALIPPQGSRATKSPGLLARSSFRSYRAWLDKIEARAGVQVSFEEREAVRLLPSHQKIRGEFLSVNDLMALEEGIVAEGLYGAELLSGCGRINTAQLIYALKEANEKSTSFQVHHAEVISCDSYPDGAHLTVRAGKSMKFDHIVLAGGHEALHPTNYSTALRPDWGQMILLQVPRAPQRLILYKRYTFVTVGPNHLWTAGYHGGERFDRKPDPSVSNLLLQVSREVFGSRIAIEQEWCGIRPRVPGGLPLVGPLDKFEKLHLVAGPGANGFLFAPLAAQTLVRRLQGRLDDGDCEVPAPRPCNSMGAANSV